jgi:DNA polymerase-3 subunit epsilon
MYCINCGEEIKVDIVYCGYCGAKNNASDVDKYEYKLENVGTYIGNTFISFGQMGDRKYKGFYYLDMGIEKAEEKKLREAIECYEQAIIWNPELTNICNDNIALSYLDLGVEKAEEKKFKEAIEFYNKALIYNPKLTDKCYNNLGVAYQGLREFEEALSWYKKALIETPNDIITLINFTNLYYTIDKYDEALEFNSRLISLEPNEYKHVERQLIIESVKKSQKNYVDDKLDNIIDPFPLLEPEEENDPLYNPPTISAGDFFDSLVYDPSVNAYVVDKVDNFREPYYLFFDTETTGLPLNWKAPVSNTLNWPRIVQIAYHTYDLIGNKISIDAFIIQPDGFTIPSEASKIHRITTERAYKEGMPINAVLEILYKEINKAKCVVAHNISFDEKVLGAEFLRNNMVNILVGKDKICTMEKSTNFCRIKGDYGYKWPKLSELHYKLFNKNFEEEHDASIDIKATAKCFWELKRIGEI